MADNVELDAGSGGAVVATDDIGGFQYQRIKLVHGIDGASSGDVASTNPLPVTVSGVAGSVTIVGDIGVSSVAGNVTVVGNIGVSSLAGGSVTANIGTVSSLATQATLGNVSTFTNSTNTLLVNVSSNTASSVSLASSQLLRLNTISTVANSTNTMLLNMIASSTSSMWVQSVPGDAQTTISTTDLIRVAVFNNADAQITSFGGGTQYVDENPSPPPPGTVMLWKSAHRRC